MVYFISFLVGWDVVRSVCYMRFLLFDLVPAWRRSYVHLDRGHSYQSNLNTVSLNFIQNDLQLRWLKKLRQIGIYDHRHRAPRAMEVLPVRWASIVPCLAEQLQSDRFGSVDTGFNSPQKGSPYIAHTNRCRRANLPHVLEIINSGSRSHEETFSLKGMVMNLDARCDRKRINTRPSGPFSFRSSSYIWSG